MTNVIDGLSLTGFGRSRDESSWRTREASSGDVRDWVDLLSFESRLESALSRGSSGETAFHLGGFAARHTLGAALVVDIRPQSVVHRLRHRACGGAQGRSYSIRDRFVGSGDWSTMLDPVRDSSTYRDVVEIVEAAGDYRATRAYRVALQRASGPKPVCRNFVALRSAALVERYFRQTAELCRSLREFGLRRRAEFGRATHAFRNVRVRRPWVELTESDVGIAIGALGEIYRFASGKHRTAAAQALGLPSIPVEVRMVHTEWLKGRISEYGLRPAAALVKGVRALDIGRRPLSRPADGLTPTAEDLSGVAPAFS